MKYSFIFGPNVSSIHMDDDDDLLGVGKLMGIFGHHP